MASGTIFGQSTLGTTNNQITFNKFGTYPIFRLKARVPTKFQIKEYNMDLPEQMGIADWQTFIGESFYVLSGVMYPLDETTYNQGRQALRKIGSLDIEQADAGSDMGYVPYTWTQSDGSNRTVNLKVEYVNLPESSAQGLKQPFQIICKVKYPVILGDGISTTIGSSTATTSGSSNLSFTLPRAIGLTTYSSNGTLYNSGDLPAWPSIIINGPITDPIITNSSTGQFLQLSGVNLPTTADSVTINYDQDSISITQAGNSVQNKLTSASTLFKLRAGSNNLTLTGSTIGSGAYAVVSCFPTFPLA